MSKRDKSKEWLMVFYVGMIAIGMMIMTFNDMPKSESMRLLMTCVGVSTVVVGTLNLIYFISKIED